LAEIQAAADRAASLTQQLLAFSRKQVIQPKVLDLNVVVGAVESLLRRLIGEDVELRTVLRSRTALVKADPNQLEQVLLNLAVNARDAMPDGGSLTLEVGIPDLDAAAEAEPTPSKTASGRVMLAVTDNGVGMDRATQERIFEPFFTTKGPGRGTGLGLSTVYGIVQQSGGTIRVKSAPGRGTTFQIFLPRAEAEEEAPAEAGAEPLNPRGHETILIVEDEAAVRKLVLRNLAEHGYEVLTADSGPAAIELVSQHRDAIQLLLTDVVMPGMSGKELYRTLSATRPEMRVLYMSGYTEDIIARQGLLEPGTELLEKPFRAEWLLQRVRQVLDRRSEVSSAAA
jgi:CheY-like chemotaxis protein